MQRKRETVPAAELIVGMQCGGSDAFSGLTANPALGYCADLLVRAGATVMFSEVTEVRDAIHLLTPRAATKEVAEALVREMRWYDDYLTNGGVDRGANTTPGNKKGGLSNIIEKSLGSVAKSGTSAINAVLSPGEKVRSRGLVFAATPASDFVCGTLQMASGMNLHVFTTGRGTPYGLAAVPVIKVSTRSELAKRWNDLIDLDAGPIATGEKTIEQVGWELFQLMLDVASGRKQVWADKWGLHNDLTLVQSGAGNLTRVFQHHRRALGGDHDGGGVGVARRDGRHHRGVDHPQALKPAHPQAFVDHRQRIAGQAHLRRAHGMEDGGADIAGRLDQIGVAVGHLRAGAEFFRLDIGPAPAAASAAGSGGGIGGNTAVFIGGQIVGRDAAAPHPVAADAAAPCRARWAAGCRG